MVINPLRSKDMTRVCMLFLLTMQMTCSATETMIQYLSGRGPDDAVYWEFFCSEGSKGGFWTEIPVPSHWETQGFGDYDYGHDVPKSNEYGIYRRTFVVRPDWRNKRVKIVFEGVMTDTSVSVNGTSVGPTHQGGFYQFKYDITDFIHVGENHLEVKVEKVSSNESVNMAERKADYWIFGGIYRPVYLEILPSSFIDWCSVDARADGSFRLQANLGGELSGGYLVARIFNQLGEEVGEPFWSEFDSGESVVMLESKVQDPLAWTAESPNLYHVALEWGVDAGICHAIRERFGFRTFEVVEGKGLYLNGTPIRLKGINRHCFWPTTGRSLTREQSYEDVRLIKEMNMNAVRMSHYPPDKHFLEACDELGLYVLNELAGWQHPPYDTPTARRLVAQLVKRDQMHPSILFWNNGNEGGWNPDVDDDFAKYDLQQRKVLHPWAHFGGIDTDHYEIYESVQAKLESGHLFMPTEFLHGLHDGGSGAGLDDYWNLMSRFPNGVGGFLWVFADEGLVRLDQNGAIDVAGNQAPDGVLGPYREKEASFYTIKSIWCPVQLVLKQGTWEVEVENRYDFRSLDGSVMEWKLVRLPGSDHLHSARATLESGIVSLPDLEPGESGSVRLAPPDKRHEADLLEVSVLDRDGNRLNSWSFEINDKTVVSDGHRKDEQASAMTLFRNSEQIRVTGTDFQIAFDATNGLLKRFTKGGVLVPLSEGPVLVPNESTPIPQGLFWESHLTKGGVIFMDTKDQITEYPAQLEGARLLASRLDYRYSGRFAAAHPRDPAKDLYIACHDGMENLPAWMLDLRKTELQVSTTTGSFRLYRMETESDVYQLGPGLRDHPMYFALEVKKQTDLSRDFPGAAASVPRPVVVTTEEAHGIRIHVAHPQKGMSELAWFVRPEGRIELECSYDTDGDYAFHGITFSYPEADVTKKRMRSNGPYPVWKNRMKGPQMGVWELDYNDSKPGSRWDFPEFKGYFSQFRWLNLYSESSVLSFSTEQEGLFFRLFDTQHGHRPGNAWAPTFKGDLSVLHCIPAIGTKFNPAAVYGPQSELTRSKGPQTIRLSFWADPVPAHQE
jgi:hypothetical protein